MNTKTVAWFVRMKSTLFGARSNCYTRMFNSINLPIYSTVLLFLTFSLYFFRFFDSKFILIFSFCWVNYREWATSLRGIPFPVVEPPSCLTGDEFCAWIALFSPDNVIDNPPDGCEGTFSLREIVRSGQESRRMDGTFHFPKWSSQNALDASAGHSQSFHGLDRSLPLQRYFPDNFVGSSLWCAHSIQR